jgi:predicted MFS family arabinose efflux permease
MLGAVLFGLAGARLGNMREACMALAAAQPLLVAPLLLAPTPAVLVLLALPAGSYAAPLVTLRSRIAEFSMPEGTGTETFTWLLLAVMGGVSAGAALAGPLIEAGGWRVGVLLAVAVPAASFPAIFCGRRLLPTGWAQ